MDLMRIVIADDHPIFLYGLLNLLTTCPGTTVVGTATDGLEAVQSVAEHHPDMALLDVRMPRMSGLEALALIRLQHPDVNVIMLSGSCDAKNIYDAIELGAHGYLLKTGSCDSVLEAIQAVQAGGFDAALSPEVQSQLASGIRARSDNILTERQREILTLIYEGSRSPAIALRLNISQATVKTHLQNIYRKLGVTDRTGAVSEALRRGILK